MRDYEHKSEIAELRARNEELERQLAKAKLEGKIEALEEIGDTFTTSEAYRKRAYRMAADLRKEKERSE